MWNVRQWKAVRLPTLFGVRPCSKLCAGGSSLERSFSLLWLVGWCTGTLLPDSGAAFCGSWHFLRADLQHCWAKSDQTLSFLPSLGIAAAFFILCFFGTKVEGWAGGCSKEERAWKWRECTCYTKIQLRQIVRLFYLHVICLKCRSHPEHWCHLESILEWGKVMITRNSHFLFPSVCHSGLGCQLHWFHWYHKSFPVSWCALTNMWFVLLQVPFILSDNLRAWKS